MNFQTVIPDPNVGGLIIVNHTFLKQNDKAFGTILK